MNCFKVLLIVKLLFVAIFGFVSLRRTPYIIETEFLVDGDGWL